MRKTELTRFGVRARGARFLSLGMELRAVVKSELSIIIANTICSVLVIPPSHFQWLLHTYSLLRLTLDFPKISKIHKSQENSSYHRLLAKQPQVWHKWQQVSTFNVYLPSGGPKPAQMVASLSSHHHAHQRVSSLAEVAASLGRQHSPSQGTPSPAQAATICRLFCSSHQWP